MSLTSFMAADRAALFSDAPVLLTSGVQTTRCWVGEEDVVMQDAGGGEALVRKTVARYRRDAITAPAIEATIALGADPYVVRDLKYEADGGVVALVVSRA